MSKVYFGQRYYFTVREKESADVFNREAVILERGGSKKGKIVSLKSETKGGR